MRAIELDYADLNYTQAVTIDHELAHQGSMRFGSFLLAVIQAGFTLDDSQPPVVRDGVRFATYVRESLPPLELEYSKATIQDVQDLQQCRRSRATMR